MHDEERIYRFGDIEVDPGAHRVTRMGREVALEPKAYAVLLALLARPGHAIERDDLLDQVWGHRHVTPGVLNRVVAQLRKALGDEAEHPRYIQTLHAVGYRFMAVPEVIVPDDATAEISAAPAAEISPFPGRSATGRAPAPRCATGFRTRWWSRPSCWRWPGGGGWTACRPVAARRSRYGRSRPWAEAPGTTPGSPRASRWKCTMPSRRCRDCGWRR